VWNISAVLRRNRLVTNSIANWWLRKSTDERLLASADANGLIQVWDRLSGARVHSVPTDTPSLFGLTFEPQGNRLAWASLTTLGILDLQSGRTNTVSISGNRGMFVGISFSPDNQEILFGCSTNVMLCDLASLQLRLFATVEEEVFTIAYSPDGGLLVFGHQGGAISLWDRRRHHKLFATQAHKELIATVEFSPDGKWLASCGTMTIQLWRVHNNELKPFGDPLRGHAGYVPSITFSPDGTRLVSASSDRTLKLWSTADGTDLGTLYGHRGRVSGVVFSRDGHRIYSTGEDGDVRVWEAPMLAEIDSQIQGTSNQSKTGAIERTEMRNQRR
jgi:WD40 repeat protein